MAAAQYVSTFDREVVGSAKNSEMTARMGYGTAGTPFRSFGNIFEFKVHEQARDMDFAHFRGVFQLLRWLVTATDQLAFMLDVAHSYHHLHRRQQQNGS